MAVELPEIGIGERGVKIGHKPPQADRESTSLPVVIIQVVFESNQWVRNNTRIVKRRNYLAWLLLPVHVSACASLVPRVSGLMAIAFGFLPLRLGQAITPIFEVARMN